MENNINKKYNFTFKLPEHVLNAIFGYHYETLQLF